MNETTFLGDIAELSAAAELVRRGYIVARPLTNGAPYDLLVDVAGIIKKVQVKKAGKPINGAMRVPLSTSKHHRGRKSVLYHGKVDCLIAVDCEINRYYVFSGEDLKNVQVYIRTEPTKNKQASGVRFADDHKIDLWFPALR